jgi:hypothetical protein
MLSQIGKFKTELNGKGADPEGLYFIRIGSCDYIIKPFSMGWLENPALTDKVVGNIAKGSPSWAPGASWWSARKISPSCPS